MPSARKIGSAHLARGTHQGVHAMVFLRRHLSAQVRPQGVRLTQNGAKKASGSLGGVTRRLLLAHLSFNQLFIKPYSPS